MSDLLLSEGDRLARRLAQKLPITLEQDTRVVLIGRSLAVNLIGALLPTIEQISRRAGTPLHALLEADARRGRAAIEIVSADGARLGRLQVDDVLDELLFRQGRLHPTILDHLREALSGDEHHATRALAACLRSRPVLEAMQKLLTGTLRLRK